MLADARAAFLMRFGDRIIPFDHHAAEAHGWLQAKYYRETRKRLPEIDSQIAAIAISRHAKIATRNVMDFTPTGVEIINPWDQ